MRFKTFNLPTSENVLIPKDLELAIPNNSSFNKNLLHFLIYIPWQDKFLKYIDPDWQPFFKEILPYLHKRTTDVHTAKCMPFINELINNIKKPVDKNLITTAFILHDIGWSKLSDNEIANSLGVTGLALSEKALGPKEKHAALGKEIAQDILSKDRLFPKLSNQQKELIYKAILYHDKPWELAVNGEIPLEIKIVCDVDHLWSFTHENFWQDTVRKNVLPNVYAKNLEKDLEDYFVTTEGKTKAKKLLLERTKEVKEWQLLSSR